MRCGVGRRSGLPGSPAAESRARDGGALLEHAKLRPDDALGHELRAGERPEPAVDRRDHAACDPVSHNFGVLGGFSQTSLRERFITMSTAHWLGTDQLGRDLLTRLIYGARISLYMGFGAVALGSVLATVIGVLSAYFGGRLDLLLQRGVDAWMAFPPLLLLMTIMSLLGPSVFNIAVVLGVGFGIQNSRIIRGVALSIKEHTYVEGARALNMLGGARRDLLDPRLKGG